MGVYTQGELTLSNGIKYKGSFENGVLEGPFEVTYPDTPNQTENIMFKRGTPKDFEGVVYKDNKVISGDWVNYQSDQCSFVNFRGEYYEGELDSGNFKPEGSGSFTSADGASTWHGTFEGNVPWDYEGVFFDEFEQREITGKWEEAPVETGKVIFWNGDSYVGGILGTELYGEGVYTLKDGRKFIG